MAAARGALRRRRPAPSSTASRSTTTTGTSTCARRTPSRCCASTSSRSSPRRTWSAKRDEVLAPHPLVIAAPHLLPIPTPFMVGRVNCYLIEDDPLTLVDTGPELGQGARRARARAGASTAAAIEDLERIVITHQHIDHSGLVDILARRSGAEVCALDLLAPVLEDFARGGRARRRARRGADAAPRDPARRRDRAALGVALASAPGAARARSTHPLTDGATLEFAGRTLQVLHRPGHSPSDTRLPRPRARAR